MRQTAFHTPPPDPDVAGALAYLRSFRPGAVESADYLEHIDGVLDRLDLFRAFFPEEFERVRPDALRLCPETGHSEGELRFVELLKAMFPVDERMEEIEGGFGTVPVFPYVYDRPETLEDVESLRLAYRLGVVLMNFPDVGTELVECLPLDAEAFESLRLVSPYAIDFERLYALCAADPEPLRFLRTAVRIARRDTDNVWFDGFCTCGECGSSIEWTEENLRFLADAWTDAQDLFGEMDEFTTWLEGDAPARLARAFDLWNRAEKDPGGAAE